MKKYHVKIVEKIMFGGIIEARDEQEADDIVGQMIDNGSGIYSGDADRLDIETEIEEIK